MLVTVLAHTILSHLSLKVSAYALSSGMYHLVPHVHTDPSKALRVCADPKAGALLTATTAASPPPGSCCQWYINAQPEKTDPVLGDYQLATIELCCGTTGNCRELYPQLASSHLVRLGADPEEYNVYGPDPLDWARLISSYEGTEKPPQEWYLNKAGRIMHDIYDNLDDEDAERNTFFFKPVE
ncbi:hypothetical protein B0H16DRAFT_253710 [Mycena metata]|uniref:Uncharacterized protein n=1 Tax=Mycena metata TaxID=1033252 RepID=A0AAD7JPL5_9AGAR|nr:hypothetical protein B0H16DRAFT_253710 [Mycena metata]